MTRWKLEYLKEVSELKDKYLRKQLKNKENYIVIDKERELFDFNNFILNRVVPLPIYLAFGASVENEEEMKLFMDAKEDIEEKVLTMLDIISFSKIYKIDLWQKGKWYWVGLDNITRDSVGTACKIIKIKDKIGECSFEDYVELWDLKKKNIKKGFDIIESKGWMRGPDLNKLSEEFEKKYGFSQVIYEFENETASFLDYQIAGNRIILIKDNPLKYKFIRDGKIVNLISPRINE